MFPDKVLIFFVQYFLTLKRFFLVSIYYKDFNIRNIIRNILVFPSVVLENYKFLLNSLTQTVDDVYQLYQ